MNFNVEMANLIESIGEVDFDKLISHREQIDNIADYCKGTGLYQRSEEQRAIFSEGIDAVECYQQMIMKIAEAQTQMMARVAAILIIPIISDKLDNELDIKVGIKDEIKI